MINIEKAKAVFREYVEPYDVTNGKIKLKIEHTFRTSEVSKKIAEFLKLDKKDIELATLIGLLHDIGRFEQLRIYDTFNDNLSIDHGDFGVKILFEDKLINRFVDDRKYDEIMYKAIKNHNKYAIEEGLNERELLHAKIIRDADKTDIFEVIVRDFENEENVLHDWININKEIVTPEVLEEFVNLKVVDRKKIKNEIDRLLAHLAFLYEYNYKEALKIVKERHYIEKILAKIEGCNETKEQTELIKSIVNNFMNNR